MIEKHDLTEPLSYFLCRACGKRREHMHINTFKHPMLDSDSVLIIGYEHFNYCYDSLICYTKAARKERYKDEK